MFTQLDTNANAHSIGLEKIVNKPLTIVNQHLAFTEIVNYPTKKLYHANATLNPYIINHFGQANNVTLNKKVVNSYPQHIYQEYSFMDNHVQVTEHAN